MTGFAKICLIAGERNCGYSPFLLAKSIFVDFLFSSNMKNMTLLLYIHIVIIVGELLKTRNKPVTYLDPGMYCHDMECCYDLILGHTVVGKSLPWLYYWPLLSSLTA